MAVYEGSLEPYGILGSLRGPIMKSIEAIDEAYEMGRDALERYMSLPEETRERIEGTLLTTANYLTMILAPYSKVAALGYALTELYEVIRRGGAGKYLDENMTRLRNISAMLYEMMRGDGSDDGRTKQNSDSVDGSKTKSTSTKAEAIASIIGLSILGLGLSFRMGTEVTGRVGSITAANLPFLLIFSVILIVTGFHLVKRKSS